LNQAKKGANFEDLAKKYSEDGGTPGNPGSRDKGGDLGWIVQGQTVPEFEKAAFSLPKGSISDLIKTQYGFHIIKIIDKEEAHTKPFDEVKDSIRTPLLLTEADKQAGEIADKLSQAIRQSNKVSLDDLTKQFHLPAAAGRVEPARADGSGLPHSVRQRDSSRAPGVTSRGTRQGNFRPEAGKSVGGSPHQGG